MSNGAGFRVITLPYVLMTFIPFFEDEKGAVWLEIAWHRDFLRHLDYLTHMTLLAPKKPLAQAPSGCLRVPEDVAKRVRFVGLPSQDSARKAVLNIPKTAWVIWREFGKGRIVQSGIVGWPFPLGWIANPIALLRRRYLVLIIESAPWRITTPGRHSLTRRIMEWLGERLGRFYVSRAHLAVVTQPTYLKTLRRPGSSCVGFVNPATWINEADVLTPDATEQAWKRKCAEVRTGLRVLFAGRLTSEKGVEVLLAACRLLEARGAPICIDIIGDGALRSACEEAAQRTPARVRVLKQVPYGPEFLALLRSYHAIVVPSVSDEQPRIIFDAYSQAVPVIASDTDGNRPHVSDETGTLVAKGSAEALALALEAFAADSDALRRRGTAARDLAATMTHEQMHISRSHLMHDLFMREQSQKSRCTNSPD
jgi:glycosyltransferase involved in cell wall biosynthesis